MMKKITMDKKKYKVKGFSKGAAPMAEAEYYYPKGIMKGWHPVKNLSIRRKLAKKLGK